MSSSACLSQLPKYPDRTRDCNPSRFKNDNTAHIRVEPGVDGFVLALEVFPFSFTPCPRHIGQLFRPVISHCGKLVVQPLVVYILHLPHLCTLDDSDAGT